MITIYIVLLVIVLMVSVLLPGRGQKMESFLSFFSGLLFVFALGYICYLFALFSWTGKISTVHFYAGIALVIIDTAYLIWAQRNQKILLISLRGSSWGWRQKEQDRFRFNVTFCAWLLLDFAYAAFLVCASILKF